MNRQAIFISIATLMLVVLLGAARITAQGPDVEAGTEAETETETELMPAPSGTAFTYQGRLNDSDGAPLTGNYDFQVTLYDAASGGSQVGDPITMDDVTVNQGLFTVPLDFGSAAFNGDGRWLEVGVRPGSSTDGYTTLPRREITAVPYALVAPWNGLIDVPAAFADGVDHTDDMVSWSEISLIVGVGSNQVAVGNHNHHTTYVNENQANSVTSGMIADNAVGGGEIASNAVGSSEVVDNSLTANDLAPGSVGSSEVVDNSLTANDLAPGSVGSSEVVDNSLTASDLGPNSVDTSEIADNAVGSGEIVNGAVGNSDLGSNAVTSVKIQDGQVTTADIADNTISESDIVDSFKARDADKLDNHDSSHFATASHNHDSDGGDITAVIAGDGLFGGGTSDDVTLSVDFSDVQKRVVGSCGYGYSIRVIYSNGTVSCEYDDYSLYECLSPPCPIRDNFALNSSESPLEPGDIVAIRGMTTTNLSEQPTIMDVALAKDGEAVVGVVASRAEVVEDEREEVDPESGEKKGMQPISYLVPGDGPAQHGEYVSLIIGGVTQVKASALAGPIETGMRLTAADEAGHARGLKTVDIQGVKVAESAPIIGIALESLAEGKEGLIWVLVNPQ